MKKDGSSGILDVKRPTGWGYSIAIPQRIPSSKAVSRLDNTLYCLEAVYAVSLIGFGRVR